MLQKMPLLGETFFHALALAKSFRILSNSKPLLISDSMNIFAKLFRRSCWIDDLK